MKIRDKEFDAAMRAYDDTRDEHPASLEAAIIAALTVRKQRKAAKRERQRKEKDKQVVESVKPAAVSAFLKDGETVLDRLKRGQRDEVMLMRFLRGL